MAAIRQVIDQNKFEAVSRFRYSISVGEVNRKQPGTGEPSGFRFGPTCPARSMP